MSLVRNAWYVAARTSELAEAPLGRVILETPIVVFRTASGVVAALVDTCPHRAVPLHRGTVEGERLRCAYHALEFDGEGKCWPNALVKGDTSRIAAQAFPLVERHGFLWIWMGDKDCADPTKIPDYGVFAGDDRFAVAEGYTKVKADYRLVIDNLMDLSHAEFLHPHNVGTAGAASVTKYTAGQDGERLISDYLIPGLRPSPMFAGLWSFSKTVDQSSKMIWNPVSNLFLDFSLRPAEGEGSLQVWRVPSAHVLTPETRTSTHYFWALARDFAVDNADLTEAIRAGADTAFDQEDRPMVEAAQTAIELYGAGMKNLTDGDAASFRVRKTIERLVASETDRESA